MTMTDLGALLWQYIERFESGGSVDPSDLLDQVQGEERRELGALIEGYLELGAPPRAWNAEAFEGSIAERAVNRATKRAVRRGVLLSVDAREIRRAATASDVGR